VIRFLKYSIFGVPLGFILVGVIAIVVLASVSIDFNNTISITTPQQANLTATYQIDNGAVLPLTNASTVYWGSIMGGMENAKVMTIHLTNIGDLPTTVHIQLPESFPPGINITAPSSVYVNAHGSQDTTVNLHVAINAPTGDLPLGMGHITITAD
jgi:hypothetical protein